MIDCGVTGGERLCNFVNHRLLQSDAWQSLQDTLEVTGRAAELAQFYRQLSAVTLTGRIVAAGQSISVHFERNDPIFRKAFREHLRDTVGVPAGILDELYRFGFRAVSAALEPLPESTRKKVRAWAMSRHPNCYICGVPLDFVALGRVNSYTLEHIWPRVYGGDSIEENLLPACDSCNSKKKRHFATWVMPAVQSLLLGISPPDQRLGEIEGSYKYSLHYRAAQRLATDRRLSLKQAFLKIGPWTDVRLIDRDDVADFFNLENHSTE